MRKSSESLGSTEKHFYTPRMFDLEVVRTVVVLTIPLLLIMIGLPAGQNMFILLASCTVYLLSNRVGKWERS